MRFESLFHCGEEAFDDVSVRARSLPVAMSCRNITVVPLFSCML